MTNIAEHHPDDAVTPPPDSADLVLARQPDGGEPVFGKRDHGDAWVAAIDSWSTSLKAGGKSHTTIRQRRWQLRQLAETYQHQSPWKLTVDDLAEWLADHDWGPETRKSARSALRSFYAWAIKTGRTKRSPAETLDAISVPRRLPRPADDDVLERTLGSADDRLMLMLLLAAQGGLRVHEIAKARWMDIVDDRWLLIRGKKGRERRIALPSKLRDALVDERGRRQQGRMGSGFRYGQGDLTVYVFPGVRGGMNPAWVSELMSEALGPGVTAHMLRHRAATVGLEETGNLAAVQEFLGHVDPETTRIYSRVSDRALQAVADAL